MAHTLPVPVSFEFFPPKSEQAEHKLWNCVMQLSQLNPDFVSVTYGAGGSTRDRTHRLVRRIREETSLEPAAHLTCVGATREEIDAIAKAYLDDGIRHIVALRGDAPPDTGDYVPHPGGYAYADDLVKGLLKVGNFDITVAAYPETHPQARSHDDDLAHLKRKFDAGAHRAITQYCYDHDAYTRFLDALTHYNIDPAQIIPGILPIGNYTQAVKFSAMCGASVPEAIHQRFRNLDPKSTAHHEEAVALACEQAEFYLSTGAKSLHFYTLNRADIVGEVCRRLGM